MSNVERSIHMVKVSSVHCWSDSRVALYWLNGQDEYRQFVSNRVPKIKERDHIHWHHVPTEDNPADIWSRGGSTVNNELWTNGPEWLSDPEKWPKQGGSQGGQVEGGRPPPPNCPQDRTCEKFKSGEILTGAGGGASSGTFLRHNQYYYMCMCIMLL